MEELDGSNLFDSMLADDPESSKLEALPGVDDILATYPFFYPFEFVCYENFYAASIFKFIDFNYEVIFPLI